jgi:hypothetical protein
MRPTQLIDTRVRFYEKSPYQARRYKPEFVGWEAWLYGGKSQIGYLITKEDWENGDKKLIIDSFLN